MTDKVNWDKVFKSFKKFRVIEPRHYRLLLPDWEVVIQERISNDMFLEFEMLIFNKDGRSTGNLPLRATDHEAIERVALDKLKHLGMVNDIEKVFDIYSCFVEEDISDKLYRYYLDFVSNYLLQVYQFFENGVGLWSVKIKAKGIDYRKVNAGRTEKQAMQHAFKMAEVFGIDTTPKKTALDQFEDLGHCYQKEFGDYIIELDGSFRRFYFRLSDTVSNDFTAKGSFESLEEAAEAALKEAREMGLEVDC